MKILQFFKNNAWIVTALGNLGKKRKALKKRLDDMETKVNTLWDKK